MSLRKALRPLGVGTFAAAMTFAATACSGNSLTPAAPVTALPSTAAQAAARPNATTTAKGLTFVTLDDQNDPTFNQLLGINNNGEIAGYFGSGASGHPFNGYTLQAPYGQNDYTAENFPGGTATQVTGLNNHHDTSGFWINNKNVNLGFVQWRGVFTSYKDPKTAGGTVNQVLGINDSGIAVGFYTDKSGINHGFTLNQATGRFAPVALPGVTNVTAAGINDAGDITGFYASASGTTGFLKKGKSFTTFSFPGGDNTMALGINSHDQIVGTYQDTSGGMHGFLLSHALTHAKWVSIDDPNGVGTTTINGLNDKGQMVGFYVDSAGNTDGMLIGDK